MNNKCLYIKGMHCASCNILIEDIFKKEKNVQAVSADFRNQTVQISYKGQLDEEALNKQMSRYGYHIADPALEQTENEPFIKRLLQAIVLFVVFSIIFLFIQELALFPNFDFNTSAGLTLTVAFILGLVASTSTCMATSGALFLSTIGTLKTKQSTFLDTFIPAVNFNFGRVLSYGVFGFILGFLGKSAAQNVALGPLLTAFVAFCMILIGLDMLQLFSLKNILNVSFTKNIFRQLEKKLIKNPQKSAFFLGALTYLLPCGFTQSVQLYAIGLADPVKSSVMMMVFALGTVPALLAIGFLSSFTRSSYYPMFAKAMGILIFMIGIYYVSNALSLYGVNINLAGFSNNAKTVSIQNGEQIVTMDVDSSGYSPSSFTIKKGIPVRWVVNGKEVFGCQGSLQAPAIGVKKTLAMGENIIKFTPQETGLIPFSCSMGMFRGNFIVI